MSAAVETVRRLAIPGTPAEQVAILQTLSAVSYTHLTLPTID
jgi:hypothetical protein